MKRPASNDDNASPQSRKLQKRAPESNNEPTRPIGLDLLEENTRSEIKAAYASAKPYPHAVIRELIDETFLRSVRNEITAHVAFTLKETDIYRIHQSGDLANLSNLDVDSLKRLPFLLKLRDALYSFEFREWMSEVTGAGKLSGTKTDMAVNVYTPGCYLLCHDDVIGSRAVSYILYLTEPDVPWQASWGGGLRLYQTEPRTSSDGDIMQVPRPEHSLNIPPSFGQMSFFAVRPGESYHDVEEVYHAPKRSHDSQRVRMAISGWYHIPQDGEDGYDPGQEERQMQNSSLAQLEGASQSLDEPAQHFKHFDEPRVVAASDGKSQEVDPGDLMDADETILSEQDLTFLLRYLTPSFLVPEMTEQLAASFEENSFLRIDQILNKNFAQSLKDYIVGIDSESVSKDSAMKAWKVARPPHKHRYQYLRKDTRASDPTPISKLLVDLLHSHAFKKWLALITGFRPHSLISQNAIARRFRRGKDYALASSYREEQPCLEFCINITPSGGWEAEERDENFKVNGKNDSKFAEKSIAYGAEEVYMAAENDDEESDHSTPLPYVGKKVDPAIYRSGNDDAEDNILFASVPSWNTFSVVLRDKDTLRFVKYVSEAAPGNRWDIKGEIELGTDAFEGEEDTDDVALSGGMNDGDQAVDDLDDDDEADEDEPGHDSEDDE